MRDRVAAGGVVVRHEAGRTLVALTREADPQQPDFVIPKGGVDQGEDVLTAARREIMEDELPGMFWPEQERLLIRRRSDIDAMLSRHLAGTQA